jgi:hypothetical protein
MPARVWVTLGLGALIVVSALTPNVTLLGATHGRWLIPTAQFFLAVQAAYIPANDPGMVDLGLNIVYLGLALNEGGAFLAVLTLWTLATNDMNRWLYRIVVVLGWMLALSVPLVLNGWIMMVLAGAPAVLGWAWLPTLAAGLAVIITCRRSRDRVEGDWFMTRPELQ